MLDILIPFMGGLGMFLIGMMLLSNGLVAFAGGGLQRALIRFTNTPFRAFVSGTVITALAQSSTATTVTLIGFVSAGLISFTQAIGVVIGASLGNTATGWIVAGLGLKVNLGFYTLPLIGIGALLKLLTRGRWAELGLALAGFGLLFIGLSTLQEGMRGLSDIFSLAELPAGGFWSRVAIMLIGLALTAILQSSTAAIATTLTALHTETINFDQATAMVIGAAIGTTLTGVLVTIGATIYAKRTALAYILFNLVAGLIAMVLLPAYSFLIGLLHEYAGLTPGAVSLATFHSLFIAVGVLLFLPHTPRFARAVERLLPERGEDMARPLDASLLTLPALALEASQRTLMQITEQLFERLHRILSLDPSDAARADLLQARHALDRAFDFVSRIPLQAGDKKLAAQRIAQLHAIDHLLRFRTHLYDITQAGVDLGDPVYQLPLEQLRGLLALARNGLAGRGGADWPDSISREATALTGLSRQTRHEFLQGPDTTGSASQVLRATDTFRWLDRAGYHIWRICHYLSRDQRTDKATPETPQDIPSAAPELPDGDT